LQRIPASIIARATARACQKRESERENIGNRAFWLHPIGLVYANKLVFATPVLGLTHTPKSAGRRHPSPVGGALGLPAGQRVLVTFVDTSLAPFAPQPAAETGHLHPMSTSVTPDVGP
jgi:hypothetical protein